MTTRLRLLIVDDSPDYLASLAAALRSGYDVDAAQDVAAARVKVAGGGFMAALVDVCLDEANPADRSGLDLTRELRKAQPAMPVIVMSALPDTDLSERAAEMGAAGFLRKPISLAQLHEVLGELAGGKLQ